jgi:archaellum component FlaC
MEDGVLRPLIEVGGAVVMGVTGWFVKGHNARITKIETDAATTTANLNAEDMRHRADLSAFQLDAERRFAKEEAVNNSLGRVHDRMDDIGKDIKTILTKLGDSHGR